MVKKDQLKIIRIFNTMSRKWRPDFRCLYVMPEVCGNAQSLEVILNRILPFRKFKNQEDALVMLGGYMGAGAQSADVIDILINIKKEYKNRITLLKGDSEDLMIRAIYGSEFDFNSWISSDGLSIINSYIKKYNHKINLKSISKNMLINIIPKDHIDFIKSLENFSIIDNYLFFHGSFDNNKTIAENNINNFLYDYTASRYVKECFSKKINPEFKDNYIFVGSHNFNDNKPFICSKYFMLGGLGPQKILVFELNSMSASAASQGKSKIYKYDFNIMD